MILGKVKTIETLKPGQRRTVTKFAWFPKRVHIGVFGRRLVWILWQSYDRQETVREVARQGELGMWFSVLEWTTDCDYIDNMALEKQHESEEAKAQ